MNERRFSISYYSEVSANITITESATEEHILVEASHPVASDFFKNWMFFSEDETEGDYRRAHELKNDPVDSLLLALHELCEDLWPGPKQVLEQYFPNINNIDTYELFRQQVLYAFITGGHVPSSAHHGPLTEEYWFDEFRTERFK